MSLILPQDNAVIDYSIISQIVSAINLQNADMQNLLTAVGVKPAQTNSTGGTIPPANALTVTVPGYSPLNGTTTGPIKIPSGITNLQSVVGIVHAPSSSAKIYCWLSQIGSGTFTFTSNIAFSGAGVYWIAVGH